ncbi:hypothetical protein [Amorphus sp. MBR-141]
MKTGSWRAYHPYLLKTEAAIARLTSTDKGNELRIGYWLRWRKWEDVHNTGDIVMFALRQCR